VRIEMIKTTLVLPGEIRGIVKMSEAVEAIREGFKEWGEDSQINAPRRRVHIPTGVRVSVHQGGVPGLGATGLMTHCEWVKPMSERQEYPRLNHPVIVLYDSAEGELKGIIVGEITCSELPNNIAVTGLRTAVTSAVGTDILARKDADTLGILGSRGQAKNHLLALAAVRKIKEIRVYSPNEDNRRSFAEEMGLLLDSNIKPVSSAKEAVRGVDMVLTATNSSVPVFDGNWLEPGVHVTTIVGSNVGLVKGGFTKAKRREIDDATVARSHVLAIASVQQAVQDEQGDIFDPVERGIIRWEQLIEIGEILAGKKEGRTSPEQITLFKNNAGQGVADVALGALVLRKVREKGKGYVLVDV
jgi:ornithine cyclodeaminase/alanine dehydrogenase-like protein (mu-crystallin family)